MDLFESLEAKINGKNIPIVFPEGNDDRVVGAVARLRAEGLIVPVILGNTAAVTAAFKKRGLNLDDFNFIDPLTYPADKMQEMVEAFVARRNGKATEEQARELLKDVSYFGTMLVYMGQAEGMVSGAIHSTGDTIRPALQIIKTKPGVSRTSGAFIMLRGSERFLFSDCAVNINPGAQELAEIAVSSAEAAKLFDIDPRVAMLSFSTKGSAKSPEVDKVEEATAIAKTLAPSIPIDGALQFDAAFVPSVAKLKAPESTVAGQASVFIFPDLQSGNIGYKIAQRLGGFEAVGPILLGLAKPVNDLSRGTNEEEIYKTAIVTAAQSLM
jgi:phosphate acetyltransferase